MYQVLQAAGLTHGKSMQSYLCMMAMRLLEMRRVLKDTGSVYLHCDDTATHYLKLLMDSVYGSGSFRNSIVWKRFNFHADAKRFGKVSDTILFYVKSDDFTFHRQRVPFSKEYVSSKFTHRESDGRRFRLSDLNPPGGRGPEYEFHGVTKPWRFTEEKMRALDAEGRIYTGSRIPQLKRYLDELDGRAVHDIWDDIPRSIRGRKSASDILPKNPSPSSNASSRRRQTKATSCWTHSAAVPPRVSPPRTWAGAGSASTFRPRPSSWSTCACSSPWATSFTIDW